MLMWLGGVVVLWARVERRDACGEAKPLYLPVRRRDGAEYCWPCRHSVDGLHSCAGRWRERLAGVVGLALTDLRYLCVVYCIAGEVQRGRAVVRAVPENSGEGSRPGAPELGHHVAQPCGVV